MKNDMQQASEEKQTFESDQSNSGIKKPTMFYNASPRLFEYAKQLRNNETLAEKLLWENLSKKQRGLRFKRQHPMLFFIADFYCHKLKLVIEVDGGIHRIPAQHEYDENRTHELNDIGITVLRFTNEEVMYEIEHVLKRIDEETGRLSSI